MKLVIIGSEGYRENVISKVIHGELSCPENIIELNDTKEAKEFFLNNVINQGKEQHIDIIIVDDIIDGNRHQNNLCKWIKESESSFSNTNFRISSLPVVLYKKDVGENSIESDYDVVLPFNNNFDDNRLIDECKSIVKKWRESILTDLEELKISVSSLKILDSSYASIIKDYKKISNNDQYYYLVTSVVSKEFIKNPKWFDYDWFSYSKKKIIEQSLFDYQKIVKSLYKYNGKAYERHVLHSFYNNYPHFLCRDTYRQQIYDKRFYISSTSHFHIPDYILTSSFPGHTATSISEIKRPNVYFEYKPQCHKNFTNYSQYALNQVSNYEDDFNNIQNKVYLTDKLGYSEEKYQVELIIGLDDRLTDFIMKKIKKHFSTVNVITHDFLMRQVEEYYKRLDILGVNYNQL